MAEVFPVAVASGYPKKSSGITKRKHHKTMKSPLSISSQPRARHDARVRHGSRSFPRTDYHFQVQAGDVVTARAERARATQTDLHAFRKMSSEYLSKETHRGYLAEMAVFALVVGLVAWPLVSLLIVLAQTANG
jgi:hypothetical protein